MGLEIEAGVLVGPTAVGKSAVAQWIAERTGAAILSADSMLVYRGMDVGTAKPTPGERGDVPYVGIDLAAPSEPFSTGAWLASVREQLGELSKRPDFAKAATVGQAARPPLIVAGGTGLYVKALLEGLDAQPSDSEARAKWTELFRVGGRGALHRAVQNRPEALALLSKDDMQNPRRLIRALERADAANSESSRPREGDMARIPPVAGLIMQRDRLAARIAGRIHRMFVEGLVEEAVALCSKGGLSETAAAAIGYAEALAVADGLMTVADAKERIAARTRQLAKRQMTWFRHQIKVEWIEVGEGDSPATLGPKVMEVWKQNGLCEIVV